MRSGIAFARWKQGYFFKVRLRCTMTGGHVEDVKTYCSDRSHAALSMLPPKATTLQQDAANAYRVYATGERREFSRGAREHCFCFKSYHTPNTT